MSRASDGPVPFGSAGHGAAVPYLTRSTLIYGTVPLATSGAPGLLKRTLSPLLSSAPLNWNIRTESAIPKFDLKSPGSCETTSTLSKGENEMPCGNAKSTPSTNFQVFAGFAGSYIGTN